MIRKISKKKRTADKIYAKNRNELLEAQFDDVGYNFCEYCERSKRDLQTHHIIFRSEKGQHSEIHNKKNLLIVCSECHNFLHDNKQNRLELIGKRGLKELFEL